MLSRRDFIKMLGGLGAAILPPFHRWFSTPDQQTELVDERLLSSGEVYEGFLLLSEDEPVPGFVKKPTVGPPIVCGVESKREGQGINAVLQFFENVEELRKRINFPIYLLSTFPDRFYSAGGYLLCHDTGRVYGVSLGYHSVDPTNVFIESTISLWAQPHFSRPFPLWSSEPLEPDGPGIVLEKVDFLPVSGIMVTTPLGYVFHWIERDILYMLMAEHNPTFEEARALVESLLLV